MDQPGRTCPLSYRHGAEALTTAPMVEADAAWIVGGLYGNVEALAAILQRVAAESGRWRTKLVFNGDFHWFDIDPDDFAYVQDQVLAHTAMAGNIEAELAAPDASAGCGCAYPAFVDDATVARSNRILQRLRQTADTVAGTAAALADLPRLLRLRIGTATVGVVHGDPEALAGWGFAVEHVDAHRPTTDEATDAARVGAWARQGRVDGFAATHTCLPWAAIIGGVPVINNGSAGMPNFHGRIDEVLVTRIAHRERAADDALHAIEHGGLRYEAVPVAFDGPAWRTRFLRQWPPESPAHASYCERLFEGPRHGPADARPPVRGPRPKTE